VDHGTGQGRVIGLVAPFRVEDGIVARAFAEHLGRIVVRGHGSSPSVLMGGRMRAGFVRQSERKASSALFRYSLHLFGGTELRSQLAAGRP
jgi:hypothetical protein